MATSNPPPVSQGGNLKQGPKFRQPVYDISKIPVGKTSGDPSTEYIVKNGHLLIYFIPGIISYKNAYSLCSLIRVKTNNSDMIHIVLFDKPSPVVKISLNKNPTFYELSHFEDFAPNLPKLPTNLITELTRRDHKDTNTLFLFAIISLHADAALILKIIESNLQINWVYIDSNGDTFLHKACICAQNAVFLKGIIQRVNTHNNKLINHSNKAKQTPLALLAGYIYAKTAYSIYSYTLEILVKNGAKILVQELTNQMRRPIMENFSIQRIEHKLPLVITFNVQQSRMSMSTNYSMYALISKPDEIHFIETKKLTSFSQEDLYSTIRDNFNSILDLNCPEILDYIFGLKFVPKNLLSKTNIDQSQTGESFLNIAARECNSPLLFKHFIKDIKEWNPKNKNLNENILLISLSKKKQENFYLLLDTIPLEVLNKLLFTKNSQNAFPINCMIDIPNIIKYTQLIIKKGCLDPDGNNLAHFAISNKNIDFLKVVIECSEKHTFTHRNSNCFNPLHLAIRESSIEATRLLLENSDRLILASQNKDGYNCLHSAIIQFNIDIFKAVLGAVIQCDKVSSQESGKINSATKDLKKRSPFLLSIKERNFQAAELLLSNGARIDIADSKNSLYPYYIQTYCEGVNRLKQFFQLKIYEINDPTLTGQSCTIEDFNFEGSPLLFYFWQYSDLDRFKEIFTAFSFRNVVKCNQERNTILHLNLYNDKLTEYLLNIFSHFLKDHKQETISFLDTMNNKGETVLSLAVTASKHTAVQTILNFGASLDIKFPGGDNILHIAIRTKNKETIAIFLCHPEIGQFLCKPNDKNQTPITSLLKSDGTGAVNAITNVGGKDIQGPNGESILHLVVQNGDEQTLELFKLKGFSWADLKDNNDRTPLHYAVEFSKAYAIKLLVERGYNIFAKDTGGKTPIHEAISRNNESVWEEMFRILVSPNYSSQLPILLHLSIEMNNFNAMKDILTRNPNLTLDKDNNSIIHSAATSPKQVAILKYLLQYLPKEQSDHILTSFNKDYLTPLHYAVYHNNVEGVRTLKEHGASITVLFKEGFSFFSRKFERQLVLYKARPPNLTYLFGYSMKQGLEHICILTEIPTFKYTHICKESALSRVSGLIPIQDLPLFLKSSCIDLISFIIRKNHVSLINTNGITLLHYAAQFSTINIINYLVETHKCNLFTLDKQNNSILYYALQNQVDSLLKDVCQLITKTPSKQINLFETPNQEGKRILEICLDFGNIEGFKHLMEKVSDLLYFDKNGQTLLHHVINCNKREEFIGSFIEKLNNLDKNLCTKCINCSNTDIHKLAPLHVAVFRGSNKIVNILLQNGAIPYVVDEYKKTALHFAVSHNTPEDNLKLIISSLLKHPKLLQMKDQHCQTPIFYCIINSNVQALSLIIEHPIDFHEEDRHGKTIIEYAIEKKSPEIWSIIFPKFCAAVETKYIVTLTLKNLFQVCMKNDNKVAFTGLLGLKLCSTFAEQEWRPLIEFSITGTANTFFLAQIIALLKSQKHLDLYFYPKSNQFTPPLLLAIQQSNKEAIKLMLKEQISLSFTRSDHCLTLYSEHHSTPLVICKRLQDGAVLTGYKICNSFPVVHHVLVNLPELSDTDIYEHSKVTELKDLSISNLTQILKSPCIESIKSVIDLPSRYKLILNERCTLIHLAAKVGSIKVLRYLLDKSSKIPELDQDGNSVLYYTLFNEITDIFKFLCDYLVDKLDNYELFNCENAVGKRILDICIETDNLSSFCILLNPKYKVKLDYIDSIGYTLFHKLIILKTRVEFFKALHERTHSTHPYQCLSSKPVESSKLTSLHLAISEDLHDHIEFMLEQKFDTCVQSKCGSYPIHLAVLKNLEKERINKIITAIPKEKVTHILNTQNNEGFTPLLLATRNGNSCTVESLLGREKIKIDTVDKLSRNALHHSILLKGDKFNLELLKLLLKHITLIGQKDSNGLTPLHYCVIQNNTEALELVLQIDKDILNESKEKKNLIHFAIESTSIPVWKRVFEELKCSSDPKAIIETKLKGETILIYCIKQNNVTAFNDILTLTPDIEAIDSKRNTPLHRAAECPKQSKILTSLIEYIERHCNDRVEQLFSTLNSDNLAPFHYAIWKNNMSAVDIFMSNKAPFVIKNDSKLTLCALNSPLSINLYSFASNNQLMIGYKVVPESPNPPVWILSQIPDMKRDAIKKVGNITKIEKLTDLHIKTILQCPSAEPVIAFMKQKLIEENRKFENECSLLLYSAKYGTLSVVEELCRTMNLYLTDTNEETILFYAFCNKDTEVLKLLLNTIFKLSKREPHPDILNAENKKGEKILEVALNNLERFSILLDGKFKISLTYTNRNGYTLLHTIMGSKRDSKFLTILLKEIQTREPDYLKRYVNISSKEESTALHLCVSNNLEANLRELLKFSPNITCEDGNGNTALHLASKLNFKSLVTILIEHVKSIIGDYPSFINAVNEMRMTPLHLSIISSNLEIALELITAGAEIYATDDSGKTVLHHAVLITEEGKRNEAISFIFQQEKEKSDLERKLIQIQETPNNDSPLHLAVVFSNNTTIKLLLKESPDLTLCDVHKQSVLHLAITKGHLEIIESILGYITQAYQKDKTDPLHVLNLQDKDGNTALHLGIKSSRDDILKELLPLNPLMNLKNSLGQTPLHIAVSRKSVILKDVLEEINKYCNEEKDSYFNALDNTGLPPLHYAIVHNHLQSVETLINSGAGLACIENEIHTLFNDKMRSPLCFYKPTKSIFQSLNLLAADQILVGYQMELKGKSIITELPDLTQTKIVSDQEVTELVQKFSENNIVNVLKCASTEPIQVAIENKLVNDKKSDKKGNWLANLASEKGHANVSVYLLTRDDMPIEEFCKAITQGVKNKIETFSKLLDKTISTAYNYQTISELTDVSSHTDKFIHHVSVTLCEAMHLSLDNDTKDALIKLLSFNPCLHYAYGGKKDETLLHLMIEKCKSNDFLEEYLEKVKLTENKITNIGKRIVDSKNSNSMTALNMSIEKKQPNNIETILSYQPNVALCDASGNSSLHFAAKTGNLEIARLIIDYISDQNLISLFNQKNSDGCTPLHLATESGSVEVCELLLQKDADCYSIDNISRTILHHAILIQDATQRKSMVEFILQKTGNGNSKIVSMSDHQSCIPLQCAVAKEQVSVVELLVPFTDTIEHKNTDLQTALHLSCIHRCDKIVDFIVDQIITHGEERVIDFKDKNSKTALHVSIDNKNHHALEKLLKAKPNLELLDASENTYLHTAVEVVDDPFFLKTILTNLSEDSMKKLFTCLNSVGLPPLQYAIMKINYLAADILVGKGARLDFQKQGEIRLCDDKDELKLQVVEYISQCWVGFAILTKSHFVITQLPSLEGVTYVSADDSRNVKPYNKVSIEHVLQQICECKSSDPFNTLLQNGLISAKTNFPQIAKFATIEVISKLFDNNKNALYHQDSGESMIESAVSNPNIDAFVFLLSKLPEFQPKDVSPPNPTDPKDAQISLCVKNSLRKSLSNGNTNVLNSLLTKFTKINYVYPNEETLIHLAISKEKTPDFLKAIFKKVGKDGTEKETDDVSFINKQSENKKQTALHICLEKKQKENLDILLKNSADPFLWDSQANTALHYSVQTNELHFVETIYNTTPEKDKLLQQTNADNHSALHLAIIIENPEIVEFLLKASSPFYPVMDNEPTLLHLAIRINNESAQTEIMEQLFKHAGHVKFPMTRLSDDKGYPPLHLATNLRNKNAVTLLLKVDPSVLYIQDVRGHTPLHVSLIPITSGIKDENKDFSIFETIFENIPAPCGENSDLLVLNKDTLISLIYDKTPCCPFCQVNKVICTQDKKERTAMHYAIQHKCLDAFNKLLATNSCLFITDEDGYTLQHEAVKKNIDIQFLIALEEELMRRTNGDHLKCFKFDTD